MMDVDTVPRVGTAPSTKKCGRMKKCVTTPEDQSSTYRHEIVDTDKKI